MTPAPQRPAGPPADRRWPRLRNATALMTLMGVFLLFVQINRTGGAVIANALAEQRGLDPASIGAVMGAMFFGSAFVQIPYGLVFDRYGPRRTVTLTSLIAILGISIFALSASTPGLLAGRVLIGFGHGGAVTSIYLLAMAWVRPERVATVSSMVIGVAGGIGGLLATAPLAFTLEHAGFAATFGALALATIAITLAIHLFVDDRPDAGTTPERPRETLAESVRGLLDVVRSRELRPIFAMGICFSAPYMTVGGLWAGPYLREVHGLSQTEAGSVLFAMTLAFNIGTLSYGPLDRVFNSRKRVVLGGAIAMLAMLVPLAAAPSMPLWGATALLAGFSLVCPFFVTLAAHCRSFVPQHRAGRAITFMSMLGVGNIFVMQGLTGLLMKTAAEHGASATTGYRLAFGFVAVVLAVCALAYLKSRDVPPRG